MPTEALPQGARKGRLSYTVTSPSTGAKVEVLLKQRAFRISRVGAKNGRFELNKTNVFPPFPNFPLSLWSKGFLSPSSYHVIFL